MTSGEQLRLVGMETALANTPVGDTDHVERMVAALSHLTKSGEAFTADKLRDRLPKDTQQWLDVGSNGNKLSALFGQHARNNHIRHIGWASPARRQRHSNPNRIWIGAHA